MKKLQLSLCLLLLTCSLFAQEEKNMPPARFISFGMSPLSALELRTPTFEPVLEIKPFDKISFELKYGFPFYAYYNSTNANRFDAQYYEARAAVNYYPNIEEAWFIGLEFFTLDYDYSRRNSDFIRDGDRFSYTSARILSNVRGVRVRSGYTWFFPSRLQLSVYGTLGTREVNTRYTSVEGMTPFTPFLFELNFQADEKEGIRYALDSTLGVKIAYTFRK